MEESATETGGVSWADSLTVAVYSLQSSMFPFLWPEEESLWSRELEAPRPPGNVLLGVDDLCLCSYF